MSVQTVAVIWSVSRINLQICQIAGHQAAHRQAVGLPAVHQAEVHLMKYIAYHVMEVGNAQNVMAKESIIAMVITGRIQALLTDM